jgi:hypothetical protein
MISVLKIEDGMSDKQREEFLDQRIGRKEV